MKQKNYLTLDDEFISFCGLNNVIDIEGYATIIFNKGFNIIKYGETPKGFSSEKIIEKVVEKEVIKEVPIMVDNESYINDLREEIRKIKEENEKMKKELLFYKKNNNTKKDVNINSLYDE